MADDVRLCSVLLCLFVECMLFTQLNANQNRVNGIVDILDAVGDIAGAVNQCKYTCPNGAVPQPRTGHKPSSNGCGSFGIQFDIGNMPGLTKCCDEHDLCYDKCGSKKRQCDKDFKLCIDQLCVSLEKRKNIDKTKVKGCKGAAKLLYGGTTMLGCSPYLESQKKACTCNKRGNNKSTYQDNRDFQHDTDDDDQSLGDIMDLVFGKDEL